METAIVQAIVTIVTTLCGYGAVAGKLNLLLRKVGHLETEQKTDKQKITDLREEVRILKTMQHTH